MPKYSTEDIRRIFKECNKTIDKEFEYRSSADKVPYTCDICGFSHSMLLRNLKKGGYGEGYLTNCKNCKKLESIDYSIPLDRSFESVGYEIIKIEGDINTNNCRIFYVCPKGHGYSVLKYYWYLDNALGKCPYCKLLKDKPDEDIRLLTFPADRDKITMSLIKESAKDKGFRLLSVGKYSGNANEKLKCECIQKGHKVKKSVNDLRNNRPCEICEQENFVKTVKSILDEEGYRTSVDLNILYGDNQKFFECTHNECGHKFRTNWNRFGYHKQRCPKCARVIQSEKKSGSNHFNWKGGISAEPYCFDWNSTENKEYYFERDESKCWCPKCMGKGRVLNRRERIRHHIDYDKKNCDPMNIITLSRKCHTYTNYNRRYYTKYFEDLMQKRFGKENSIGVK